MGKLEEFNPELELWECYIERYEQFFEANEINNRKKMVAVFLASVGSKVCSELRDLASPTKPSELTFEEINNTFAARCCPESTTHQQRKKLKITESH